MDSARRTPTSVSPRYITLGTAGHIDHGKTELVKALTGIDPDRLKEEKARGITIDIGFGYMDLPSGTQCAIVDVPGHEDFIRNMLAGVGGIDVVLLVIAADEGVKPQTKEHFDICRLLDIPRGIIVITKADLADGDLLDLVESEARDLVKGTRLEGSPCVRTSPKTLNGIDALQAEIDAMARTIPPSPLADAALRLPIDRVFAMSGFGTVVTGTVSAGKVSAGGTVEIFHSGAGPEKFQAKVRSLQSHKRAVDSAVAGQRTAVNLQGVRKESIGRGDVICSPGTFDWCDRLDVQLSAVRPLPHPLRSNSTASFHLRTHDSSAKVFLHHRKELAAGESALATLVLDRPTVAVVGDRFILLGTAGIQRTMAGGVILDPRARKSKYRDKASSLNRLAECRDDEVVDALLSLHGNMMSPAELAARLGCPRDEALRMARQAEQRGSLLVLGTDTLIRKSAFDDLRRKGAELLAAFHREHPYEKGMGREEIRQKLGLGVDFFAAWLTHEINGGSIRLVEDRLALSQFEVGLKKADERLRDWVLEIYRAGGSTPPTVQEVQRQVAPSPIASILQFLSGQGDIVRVDPEIYMHREALEHLREQTVRFFERKNSMTPADLKELAGITRKHAIPLLEYFDRIRLTRREGDVRKLHLPDAKVK